MNYKLILNSDNTKYVVEDEEGNVIATYRYKSKAIDHVECLNNNKEFVPKPIEYYKEIG